MTTAVVLSAGLGTRLRPLTDTVPKPMVPLDGVPLLEHTIRHLAAQGVTDVAVNLHHLPQTVIDHFGDGSNFGVRLHVSVERELLGTAGALNAFRPLLRQPFVVWYGDVFSTVNLQPMTALLSRTGALGVVGLHRVDNPTQCGLVDMDADGRILRFVEKPPVAFTDLANAGVYVLHPAVLDSVPDSGFCDFGHHVFPALLHAGKPLYGYHICEYLIDVGSPEKLARADKDVAAIRAGASR